MKISSWNPHAVKPVSLGVVLKCIINLISGFKAADTTTNFMF